MKKVIAFVLALTIIASVAVFSSSAATKVTGITQVDATTSSFKIRWNDDFGASKTIVKISASGPNGDYNKTETSYSFEEYVYGLSAGKTYYVKLTPYIDNREATEYTSDPFPVATAPNSVVDLKQTNATTNSYKISWSAAYGATKYGIYRYANSTEQLIGTTTKTSYTVKKVSNKARLDYSTYVRAIRNVNGYDAKSYYSYLSSYDVNLVPKKSNIKVSSTYDFGVVYFDVNSVPFQKGYEINVYKANKKKVYTSGTGYRYEGFKKGQFYKAKARAWTQIGAGQKHYNGKWSKFTYFTLGCKNVSGKGKSHAINVSWSKVKGGKVKYDIYVSKSYKSGLKKFKKNVSGSSVKVTKYGKSRLSSRTYYYVYVQPKLKVGKKWVKSPVSSYYYTRTN